MNAPPRRLLICSYYFPPSAAVAVHRMLGFARHLPRCGWQAGFVAPPRVPGEPVDEALVRRLPPGTPVFAAPVPQILPARVARRYVGESIWLPRAAAAVRTAVRRFRPDAILTSGPPHCVHYLGLLARRLYGLPWVASFRDPWYTNGAPDAKWLSWETWNSFWEKRVMCAADCIVANTPRGRDGLQRAYPRHAQKMTYITNGFDPEFFPIADHSSPALPLRQCNERLTILHAGELYAGRDCRPLLAALRGLEQLRLPAEPSIRFRLLGQSTENAFNLTKAIDEAGLQHVVEIGGQVPYAQALAAMAQADVLLLLDTPGRRIGVPAKLFEYLGTGRPILALAEPDSDVAWVLQTSGMAHRLVPPREPHRLQQALVELRDGLRLQQFNPPEPERLEVFTRARLTQSLAGHLNRIVSEKRAARSRGAAGSIASDGPGVVTVDVALPPGVADRLSTVGSL